MLISAPRLRVVKISRHGRGSLPGGMQDVLISRSGVSVINPRGEGVVVLAGPRVLDNSTEIARTSWLKVHASARFLPHVLPEEDRGIAGNRPVGEEAAIEGAVGAAAAGVSAEGDRETGMSTGHCPVQGRRPGIGIDCRNGWLDWMCKYACMDVLVKLVWYHIMLALYHAMPDPVRPNEMRETLIYSGSLNGIHHCRYLHPDIHDVDLWSCACHFRPPIGLINSRSAS